MQRGGRIDDDVGLALLNPNRPSSSPRHPRRGHARRRVAALVPDGPVPAAARRDPRGLRRRRAALRRVLPDRAGFSAKGSRAGSSARQPGRQAGAEQGRPGAEPVDVMIVTMI